MRLIRDEYGYAHDLWDHRCYLKPLKKVKRMGWRLERMLIVDDTPEKCARNYGDAVHPLPFGGDKSDAELLLLADYLATLKDEPNMRRIEKRRWRHQMTASGNLKGRDSQARPSWGSYSTIWRPLPTFAPAQGSQVQLATHAI